MIVYSLSGHARQFVFFLCFGLALLVTIVLSVLLETGAFTSLLGWAVHPNWLELFAPDTHLLGFLGTWWSLTALFIWLFSKFAWRWQLVRNVVSLPDLNGTWMGTLERTEYPSGVHETGTPVIMTVTQTYLRIAIDLTNPAVQSISSKTESDTVTVGIDGDTDRGFWLNHIFRTNDMFGAARLKYLSKGKEETLEGEYVSSVPRKGMMALYKLPSSATVHEGEIRLLKSEDGDDYLAVSIDAMEIDPWRRKLAARIPAPKLAELVSNREKRDRGGNHLTIVPPYQYAALAKDRREALLGQRILYAMIGLGGIVRGDAEAYYVIVDSQHAAMLRKTVGLERHDFHVTLGFMPHDIHDHPKDRTTRLT